ncbi:little elongation complex subunit 1 isoform X1 [Erpetoichthys calabaricus]|uniref:little elongation complex subunit 1 isoform X1 n=1 Tax=Erpetoichthys calabaricus TaxID=27687 RepID=UPI0022344B8E|nr:little elongation complex subunit 1 isoform X1 [Erpetoichthys calabaricus]
MKPLEKQKEDLDSLKTELEEKKCSIKMYQQTFCEMQMLKDEHTKTEALKKKYEMQAKKLEETTAKQNSEIKQLRKEKKHLEKHLERTQKNLEESERRIKEKVLKHVSTQITPPKEDRKEIDKSKVQLLLQEIWMCIEPSGPESQWKENMAVCVESGKQLRMPPSVQSSKPNQHLLNELENQFPCHSTTSLTSPLRDISRESSVQSSPLSSPGLQHTYMLPVEPKSKKQKKLKRKGTRITKNDDFITTTALNGQTPEHSDKEQHNDSDFIHSSEAFSADSCENLEEIMNCFEPLPPPLSPVHSVVSHNQENLFGDISDLSEMETDGEESFIEVENETFKNNKSELSSEDSEHLQNNSTTKCISNFSVLTTEIFQVDPHLINEAKECTYKQEEKGDIHDNNSASCEDIHRTTEIQKELVNGSVSFRVNKTQNENSSRISKSSDSEDCETSLNFNPNSKVCLSEEVTTKEHILGITNEKYDLLSQSNADSVPDEMEISLQASENNTIDCSSFQDSVFDINLHVNTFVSTDSSDQNKPEKSYDKITLSSCEDVANKHEETLNEDSLENNSSNQEKQVNCKYVLKNSADLMTYEKSIKSNTTHMISDGEAKKETVESSEILSTVTERGINETELKHSDVKKPYSSSVAESSLNTFDFKVHAHLLSQDINIETLTHDNLTPPKKKEDCISENRSCIKQNSVNVEVQNLHSTNVINNIKDTEMMPEKEKVGDGNLPLQDIFAKHSSSQKQDSGHHPDAMRHESDEIIAATKKYSPGPKPSVDSESSLEMGTLSRPPNVKAILEVPVTSGLKQVSGIKHDFQNHKVLIGNNVSFNGTSDLNCSANDSEGEPETFIPHRMLKKLGSQRPRTLCLSDNGLGESELLFATNSVNIPTLDQYKNNNNVDESVNVNQGNKDTQEDASRKSAFKINVNFCATKLTPKCHTVPELQHSENQESAEFVIEAYEKLIEVRSQEPNINMFLSGHQDRSDSGKYFELLQFNVHQQKEKDKATEISVEPSSNSRAQSNVNENSMPLCTTLLSKTQTEPTVSALPTNSIVSGSHNNLDKNPTPACTSLSLDTLAESAIIPLPVKIKTSRSQSNVNENSMPVCTSLLSETEKEPTASTLPVESTPSRSQNNLTHRNSTPLCHSLSLNGKMEPSITALPIKITASSSQNNVDENGVPVCTSLSSDIQKKSTVSTLAIKSIPSELDKETILAKEKGLNKYVYNSVENDASVPSAKKNVMLGMMKEGELCGTIPTVHATADTSTSSQPSSDCLRKMRSEMGPPLPPLLAPLTATPPRVPRPVSPLSSSFMSPMEELVSPLKETPIPPLMSPLSDVQKCKSLSFDTPSPSDMNNLGRIQSSPLQFCAATPKHALPVPGRLPQSAVTASTSSASIHQENSVKILDTMYPELSARARTLNILKGNVKPIRFVPSLDSSLLGQGNRLSGFTAINPSATVFTKTVKTCDSKNSPFQPPKETTESKRLSSDQTRKRPFVLLPKSAAKKLCLDGYSPVANRLNSPVSASSDSEANKLDNPLSEVNRNEKNNLPETVTTSSILAVGMKGLFEKIEHCCFDLWPVVHSHIIVGNISVMPVMRDEEKEVIYEICVSKKLSAEEFLSAIAMKLKTEKNILSKNYLQALCRVYVGICRQLGDLERARVFAYNVLKEGFPDSEKLALFIASTWCDVFSMQGLINKSVMSVIMARAKGDILKCFQAYTRSNKSTPCAIAQVVSGIFIALETGLNMRFQSHEKYGEDLSSNVWEYIYATELLCTQQQWTWTHDNLICKQIWPQMDKWIKQFKASSQTSIPEVSVAAILRLIGRLGQIGMKEGFLASVKNVASVINTFGRHSNKEGMPWGVQLAAFYAIYDLSPCNPKEAMDSLATWRSEVSQTVPPAVTSCLTQLNCVYRQMTTLT